MALIDGTVARAAVPSGASTGEHEAVELRDGGSRYGGKGVEKAVEAVLDEIAPRSSGCPPTTSASIDQALLDLDGTPDKSAPGRQRHPGRVPGGGQARRGRVGRSAAVPLPRWTRTPTSFRCR